MSFKCASSSIGCINKVNIEDGYCSKSCGMAAYVRKYDDEEMINFFP